MAVSYPNAEGGITAEVGYEPVVIDKVYGPTWFDSLKIQADFKRGWVISRLVEPDEGEARWVEEIVLPGDASP